MSSRPLGIRRLAMAIAFAVVMGAACHDKAPTQAPADSLTGTWTGSLSQGCFASWSAMKLTLEQVGESVTGILETKDGQTFGVYGTITNGSGRLTIDLPMYSGECPVMGIGVLSVSRTSFMSQMGGRCCGTISETVVFLRSAGA